MFRVGDIVSAGSIEYRVYDIIENWNGQQKLAVESEANNGMRVRHGFYDHTLFRLVKSVSETKKIVRNLPKWW